MLNLRRALACILSLALHVALMIPLAYVHTEVILEDGSVTTATLLAEDRPPEEFTRELNRDTLVSESLLINTGVGGIPHNSSPGATLAPRSTPVETIEKSAHFKDPQATIDVRQLVVPGSDEIDMDPGESEIIGDMVPVINYPATLGRITQEILRLVREDKLLVVWMFDESQSMQDDQAEIATQFHKVYEELGIILDRDSQFIGGGNENLLTAVHSYGIGLTALTPKPTADIQGVRAAIGKIGVDESGQENMCTALNTLIDTYQPIARTTNRKLAFIIVTDESGDDGQLIDATIAKARQAQAPVYVLGRESIFGYPFAHVRWQDPQFGLTHLLQIKRGPETPFIEALQFDGFQARRDAQTSGFGPYEQARLARETGGVFFMLPDEEQNLAVQNALDRRKFAFLDLKAYVPSLQSRSDYEEARNKSKFRSAVWDVASRLLNPYVDPELSVQQDHYPIGKADFENVGKTNFAKAVRTMGLLNEATQLLEKVKPLRDTEDSQRWRANYDLMLAQTMAYRVRLFQFVLALHMHNKNFPTPKDPQNNEWNVIHAAEMLVPDADFIKATNVDVAELKKQQMAATELYMFVLRTHPGTPWASRAEVELSYGFGQRFQEGFHDPRYRDLSIKMPQL